MSFRSKDAMIRYQICLYNYGLDIHETLNDFINDKRNHILNMKTFPIHISKDKIELEMEKLRKENERFNKELAEERSMFAQELTVKRAKKTA
jgi:hypothetical protein